MANLQKWGDLSSWTDGAFNSSSSDLNIGSFVTGYGVLGSGVISNSGLDLYMDVSFQCTSISPGTNPFFALYLLPVFNDGSTYADGATGSTAANQPTASFLVGTVTLRTEASVAQNVMFRGIVIPPGSFKLYFLNMSGVTMPATGTVCKYRTYAENNNG